MSLVRTSGVLGTVAKLDAKSPDAARTLVRLGLYESMLDQRDGVWDEIGPDVLSKMADTLVVARTALIRGHIGKSADGRDEDLVYARHMALLETHIEKGLGDLLGGLRDLFNRKHPRDAQGQFIASAHVGTHTTTDRVDPVDSQASLHTEARAKVDRWKQDQVIDDNTPIVVRHKEIHRGQEVGTRESTTTAGNLEADLKAQENAVPNTLQLASLHVAEDDAKRGKTAQQRVAMDIMTGMMGGDRIAGNRMMRMLPLDADGKKVTSQTGNAREWHRPGAEGDRQSYRRMSMTGGLLSAISGPGTAMSTVGGLAQLIGNLGPEAEKVLGPGIQRTAYRYRGTERRPEKAILDGVREAEAASADLDFDRSKAQDPKQQARLTASRSKIVGRANPVGGLSTARDPDKSRVRADADPVALTNHYWMDQSSITEDWRGMGMRGDAVVVNLLKDLPDKELTSLGVESGEMPPSQGVIINANGKVVSQAMGYNGDHYLPFDLKNLNALHGGQYVRTRAYGGPTTEDIYTGLLTGARQIQVVSNSGVFTVEFDPDLRGGRRYSDKAARMIGRYGKLLETIVGGEVYQTDLSREKMKELRNLALKRSVNNLTNYKANLQVLTDQARLMGSIASEDEDDEMVEGAGYAIAAAIKAENKSRATQGKGPLSTGERGAVADEAQRKFEADKADPGVRTLKLDGPGYDRALKTLKQEFPYYIRQAKWESLPDYLAARGIQNTKPFTRFAPQDSGYVKPGQTHFKRTTDWSKPVVAPAVTDAAAPGAAGAAAATGEVGTGARTIAQATAPDTPYMNKLAEAVGQSLAALHGVELGGEYPKDGATEDEVAGHGEGGFYANWKIQKFMDKGATKPKACKQLAEWLVSPTTPPNHRIAMLRDLNHTVRIAEEYAAQRSGFNTADVDKASLLVKELVGFRFPFAAPENDPVLAIPEDVDPKPQPFEDIPQAAGVKPYTDYLAKAYHEQQGFASKVEALKTEFVSQPDNPDWEGIAGAVKKIVLAVKAERDPTLVPILRTEAADTQKAYAFITLEHAGRELRKLDPSSGAAPLDPGTTPVIKGRRRIVFHKADEDYSRQVREALGLPRG